MPAQPLRLDNLNFTTINVELKAHIFTITLNRPHRKNAINDVMVNEMVYALEYAKRTHYVRVVVLAAEGDIFCAGGDLKAMQGDNDSTPSNVPVLCDRPGETDEMVLRLYHLNKPVIAKVQGSVYAGALLMVCNATHVIAAEHANFGAPEILRGLWPFQVMVGLFNVMSQRDGLDFIMRGQPIKAGKAKQLGLVNQTVPAHDLDHEVNRLAKEFAALAPGAMKMGLSAYRDMQTMSVEQALPFLKERFFECLKSDDAKEGIAAFVEKRKPNWK